MALFNFLILSVFIASSIYISYLNPIRVTLKLTRNMAVDLPLIILILCASLVGVLLVSMTIMHKNSGILLKNIIAAIRNKKRKRSEELFSKGYCLYLGEKKVEAAEIFNKVISRNAQHLRAFLFSGDIKREQGNFNDAIDLHISGRRINPNDLDILYSLVDDYEVSDRLNDAFEVIKQIRNIDHRSPRPLEKLRSIYEKKEEWKKAVGVQKELLLLFKDADKENLEKKRLAALQYQLGLAQIKKNDLLNGVDALLCVVKIDPSFIPAYVVLGKTYISLEKIKDAVAIWEKGYKATKAFIILKNLVDLYQQSDDDEAAFEAYQWAISVNPDTSYLHLMLGEFYVRKSRAEEGVKELEEAKKGFSSEAPLHLILAMGYETLGKNEESAKEYHLAFKAGTKDLVGYICSSCAHSHRAWLDKCPSCGEFNSLKDHSI